MSRWLPATNDPIVAGRAKLIIVTSLGVMFAAWALVLTWLISGDLEGITVIAAMIFSAVMIGLAALARSGRMSVAAWLLVILLCVLILADTADLRIGLTLDRELSDPDRVGGVYPRPGGECGCGCVRISRACG